MEILYINLELQWYESLNIWATFGNQKCWAKNITKLQTEWGHGLKMIPSLPSGLPDADILFQNPFDLSHRFVPMPSGTFRYHPNLKFIILKISKEINWLQSCVGY